MKILTGRNPSILTELLFIETDLDHPGRPIHPSDLHQKAILWIMNNKDFSTVSEIPIITAQMLVRKKSIKTTDIEILYRDEFGKDRKMPLDIEGEFIIPWPENPGESIFELDFYIRYS